MEKITTQVTITAIAKKENENSIIQSAIAFISNINNIEIKCEKINDIKAVLSEAIDNVINFAYPTEQGKVIVTISICENKVIRLKIRDFGCGIYDISKAIEPFFTTGKEHSGMGFTIMKSLSNNLTLKSTVNIGTIVTMEINI